MRALMVFLSAAVYAMASCNNLQSVHENQFDELTRNVARIINEIYASNSTEVNFISASDVSNDFKDKLFEITFKPGNVVAMLESSSNVTALNLRTWNVFLVDSVESFTIIYNKMSPKLFELHGYYTIVITRETTDGVNEIFEALWRKQIYNVVVVYQTATNIKLLKIDLFSPESCFDYKVVEVGNHSELFIDQLKNLNQCSLNVHAPDWAPFSFLIKDEATGRDFDLIKVISEVLNFKLNFTILTELASWGMIFDNGTLTGAIKNLIDYKADIIIGDYYLRPARINRMDASVSYFTADIVFVIPPGRMLVSIEKLIQPFSKIFWTLLSASFLLAFLFIFMINCLKEIETDLFSLYFKTLSVLLSVSLPRLPKKSVNRFLLVSFVLSCIVLQAIYQGLLFKFLQTDSKLREVQSINEMVKSNFTFYIYDSMFEMIQSERRITERLITMPYEDFKPIMTKLRSSGFQGAMVSGLNEIIIINQHNDYNFSFLFCKERVMGIAIVMYFRKNFFLVPKINEVVRNLVSAGLIDHWHHKYIIRKLSDNTGIQVQEPKVMTMDHLVGCFEVWACGCLIGILCFLSELVLHQFKRHPINLIYIP